MASYPNLTPLAAPDQAPDLPHLFQALMATWPSEQAWTDAAHADTLFGADCAPLACPFCECDLLPLSRTRRATGHLDDCADRALWGQLGDLSAASPRFFADDSPALMAQLAELEALEEARLDSGYPKFIFEDPAPYRAGGNTAAACRLRQQKTVSGRCFRVGRPVAVLAGQVQDAGNARGVLFTGTIRRINDYAAAGVTLDLMFLCGPSGLGRASAGSALVSADLAAPIGRTVLAR